MDINIGCGTKPIEGHECINVDIRKTDITDIVHDLEVLPLPFEDEQFENAWAIDILEHLWLGWKFIRGIDEIWRIVKPDGHLYIRTNYYQREQAYRDPTHIRFFTLDSFDFFDPTTPTGAKYRYTDKTWEVLSRQPDGDEILIHMRKRAYTNGNGGQHE